MRYFAYGANTNRRQMVHRCPGALYLGLATLTGYELVFRGVADLRLAADRTVKGAIWDLDQTHLLALDRFEGYPTLYGRELVTVECDGRLVSAVVYRMPPGRQVAPPSRAYLDTLAAGYAACGLPAGQLESAIVQAYAEHDGEAVYRSRQWGEGFVSVSRGA